MKREIITLSAVQSDRIQNAAQRAVVHPTILTGATNTDVAWSSTAPGVATVSSTGLVRAILPGSATIITTSGSLTVGTPISLQILTTGYPTPTFSGTVPAGMNLTSGGLLTGTPYTVGHFVPTRPGANLDSTTTRPSPWSHFTNPTPGAYQASMLP